MAALVIGMVAASVLALVLATLTVRKEAKEERIRQAFMDAIFPPEKRP